MRRLGKLVRGGAARAGGDRHDPLGHGCALLLAPPDAPARGAGCDVRASHGGGVSGPGTPPPHTLGLCAGVGGPGGLVEHHRPMGPPPPSVSPLRFVPLLPRSVGFLPTFPPRAGLGASRQPSPATPSQAPARRPLPSSLVPTRRRRRPPPPMLGNDDGQSDGSPYPSRAGHATGTLCGARKRWCPALCGHQRGADGIPRDGACAVGAGVRCAPIMRLGGASHGEFVRGRQASVRLLEEDMFA